MLPADSRLRRRAEFSDAVRRGRRGARGALVAHLYLPPDRGSAPARAGFVVARTVGGAVVRNRVRRRLRHLVRDRLSQLPPGSVLVLRATPVAPGRSFAELGTDVDATLATVSR